MKFNGIAAGYSHTFLLNVQNKVIMFRDNEDRQCTLPDSAIAMNVIGISAG